MQHRPPTEPLPIHSPDDGGLSSCVAEALRSDETAAGRGLVLPLALLTACDVALRGESTGTDCPTPSRSEGDVRNVDDC